MRRESSSEVINSHSVDCGAIIGNFFFAIRSAWDWKSRKNKAKMLDDITYTKLTRASWCGEEIKWIFLFIAINYSLDQLLIVFISFLNFFERCVENAELESLFAGRFRRCLACLHTIISHILWPIESHYFVWIKSFVDLSRFDDNKKQKPASAHKVFFVTLKAHTTRRHREIVCRCAWFETLF